MTALAMIEVPDDLPLGLSFDDMTVERWRSIGRSLASAHRAVNWHIGDWWNAGEPYGSRVEDAAKIFPHLSHQTMRNLGSIAGKFDVSRRRYTLDWTLYAEVASLSLPDADRLLDDAERHGWSSRELRDAAVILRPEPRVGRWMQKEEASKVDRPAAIQATYDLLSAAAKQGRPCPNADELLDALSPHGVSSPSTTVALMHVLEDRGQIEVKRYQRSRVVTILATGDSTAEPVGDTSPHWRDRPRDVPTPSQDMIQRAKPSIAAVIFARARARGMSAQDFLAHLVWLGWEVECSLDSRDEARAA
jgi:hypothetical protein